MRKSNQPHYSAVHMYLRNNYGSASMCEFCDNKKALRYEWALKKGCKYKNKVENFIQLCASCHRKYDFTEEIRNKYSSSHKGITPSNIRHVTKFSKGGNVLSTYKSIAEAARKNKMWGTAISNNLSGASKYAGRYVWKYTSDTIGVQLKLDFDNELEVESALVVHNQGDAEQD